MTNSSLGQPDKSLDDVYNKLRRCPYPEACIEYTMATMHLGSNAHRFQCAEAADPVLKTFGWTTDALFEESIRLAAIIREEENANN